ncbi:hypothetical protein L6452_31285 [Arctium lappa]|uniref:Uncharacterized protein n=1 Tax=Arctium lappa TaxID=4217 RepID=A0ACB8ZKL5_ARCLA|nr:hypothetical protein L6452_31285 [Arctium lappa]
MTTSLSTCFQPITIISNNRNNRIKPPTVANGGHHHHHIGRQSRSAFEDLFNLEPRYEPPHWADFEKVNEMTSMVFVLENLSIKCLSMSNIPFKFNNNNINRTSDNGL